MSYLENPFYKVKDISDSIGLAEKEEGIRRVLFCLFFLGPGSTKEIARFSRLPLPVVAAIRKEFENSGILNRASGLVLTEKGVHLSENLFHAKAECLRLETGVIEKIKRELSEFSKERPVPDRSLDQSHSTIETQINRVQHMLFDDSLIGRDIAILGDDDITSITICLYLQHIFRNGTIPCRIRVYECDQRLTCYISNIAGKHKYPVNVTNMDLKEKMEPAYLDINDIVFTDPPYTANGVRLFLSRAVEMLKWGTGRKIYLNLPRIMREDLLSIQKDILKMNLLIESVLPGFNKYQGNSLYSNQSDLYLISTCQTSRSIIAESDIFNEDIYTFEVNPKIRYYRCTGCNKIFATGTGKLSIEILKQSGCDVCRTLKFERVDPKLINAEKKQS